MRMILKINLLPILMVILLLGSLSYAIDPAKPKPIIQPTTPSSRPDVKEEKIPVPNQPNIIEFSISPNDYILPRPIGPGEIFAVVAGERIKFRWRVEPGMRGGAITRVTIGRARAVTPLIESSNASGESIHLAGGLERYSEDIQFELKATNASGATSIRSIPVRKISIADALERFLQINLEANPREFQPGQNIDFNLITFLAGFIHGYPVLTGAHISVKQGSHEIGSLLYQTIEPRPRTNYIRSGYIPSSTMEDFVVNVTYRGQSRMKRFSQYPVPSSSPNLFTLNPRED